MYLLYHFLELLTIFMVAKFQVSLLSHDGFAFSAHLLAKLFSQFGFAANLSTRYLETMVIKDIKHLATRIFPGLRDHSLPTLFNYLLGRFDGDHATSLQISDYALDATKAIAEEVEQHWEDILWHSKDMKMDGLVRATALLESFNY